MEGFNLFDDLVPESRKKDYEKHKKQQEKDAGIRMVISDTQQVMIDTSFFLSNALLSLLIEKGIITDEEVDQTIDELIARSHDEGDDEQ